MIQTIWEWALRIITALAMLVGVLGLTAGLLFLGWLLIEVIAKYLKVVGVIWEFVYFKYRRKSEAFVLKEMAQLRVELEKARAERDDLRRRRSLVPGPPTTN